MQDYAERRALRGELRLLAKEERARQQKAVAECLARASVVCATLTGCLSRDLEPREFDLAVVDEAAQVLPCSQWGMTGQTEGLELHRCRFIIPRGSPQALAVEADCRLKTDHTASAASPACVNVCGRAGRRYPCKHGLYRLGLCKHWLGAVFLSRDHGVSQSPAARWPACSLSAA